MQAPTVMPFTHRALLNDAASGHVLMSRDALVVPIAEELERRGLLSRTANGHNWVINTAGRALLAQSYQYNEMPHMTVAIPKAPGVLVTDMNDADHGAIIWQTRWPLDGSEGIEVRDGGVWRRLAFSQVCGVQQGTFDMLTFDAD